MPPHITDRVTMFVLQACVKNLCTLPPNNPRYIEAHKRLMTWVEALPKSSETALVSEEDKTLIP